MENNSCSTLEEALKEIIGDEGLVKLIIQLRGKKCKNVRKALQELWPEIIIHWLEASDRPAPDHVFETLVLALCKEEPSLIDKLVDIARAIASITGKKSGG